MRNFQKLKVIEDYQILDSPEKVNINLDEVYPENDLMFLRMLVRPKYGEFIIPKELNFLKKGILKLAKYDRERTGIKDSWCYVTIRHGKVTSTTDDEWHFDGSSFRTDIIPERNYVWVNNNPTEYKIGNLKFPKKFNPIIHNLFTYVSKKLKNKPILLTEIKKWYLLSPFCLHRRPFIEKNINRTFYRICFTDIEGRDINNTQNPLLHTEFFGRDPVKTFRNKLL